MFPSRRTQPYRRGAGREPGPALDAMLAGRPSFLPNPSHAPRPPGSLADAIEQAKRVLLRPPGV